MAGVLCAKAGGGRVTSLVYLGLRFSAFRVGRELALVVRPLPQELQFKLRLCQDGFLLGDLIR